MKQQNPSVVSKSSANSECAESTSLLEHCTLEAGSSSISQDTSDDESVNKDTSGDVTESDVIAEDAIEVENLDFCDQTISDCNTAAEESSCSSNVSSDVNSLPGSSTIQSVVDQEFFCESNAFVNQAVNTEDSWVSQTELLEKLSHQ